MNYDRPIVVWHLMGNDMNTHWSVFVINDNGVAADVLVGSVLATNMRADDHQAPPIGTVFKVMTEGE